MKTAIRYYTKSGNTEKLAKAISDALEIPALTVESALEERVDILFLGCSYYAFDMDPAVKTFLKENKDKIGKIACFGTSAMMKSMKRPLKKAADGLGIAIADAEFHCRGSFKMAHPGRPNAADLQAAQEFAKKICGK